MTRSINGNSVCVVGGAGFLGSHLVNHLVNDRGCSVLVVDNLVVGSREFIHPRAKFVHHDITGSEEYLTQLLCDHGVEYLFNYAAYPYIPDSFDRPLHVFNVNAFGALKVINAAHISGCRGILQVSSAEIYGGGQFGCIDAHSMALNKGLNDQIDECGVVYPHSSYGASKAAIDGLVQARWREAKTPCISLRQFNCVGERETHPYVVPEIISQLTRQLDPPYFGFPNKAVVCLGNNSFRDFMYAGDAVRMAVELLEKGEFGEVYNLGSQNKISIYDLAQKIGAIMGFSSLEVKEDPARNRPWEIWHLQSDNGKIYKVIDSRPGTTLDDALDLTISHFKANGGKWAWEAGAGHGTSMASERMFTVNSHVEMGEK